MRRIATGIFFILWTTLAAGGVLGLSAYSLQPGHKGEAAKSWPSHSTLAPSSDRPTLLVFLHPECACSRATVADLDALMADLSEPMEVKAVFIRPKNWSIEKIKGELWESAARIPGVSVELDSTGEQAKLFGAATSGHTVLYSANGELLFSGGLTSARGHVGDNDGSRAILEIARNGATRSPTTDVFGCGLFDGATARKLTATLAKLVPGMAP